MKLMKLINEIMINPSLIYMFSDKQGSWPSVPSVMVLSVWFGLAFSQKLHHMETWCAENTTMTAWLNLLGIKNGFR